MQPAESIETNYVMIQKILEFKRNCAVAPNSNFKILMPWPKLKLNHSGPSH